MKVFANTDIGLVRRSNQDTFRHGVVADDCLWSLVCDGMGGVNGGNIASTITADTIAGILNETLLPDMDEEAIRTLSFHAISQANSAVFSRAVDEPALKGMGTTAVLAIVCKNKLYLSHVGDSRAYLLRNQTVTQITVDHSFVQDLVDKGAITKEEARTHPNRNIITRSVGVHSMVENDYQELCVESGDIFLSCSDGLSNYATDEIIQALLEKQADDQAVTALIGYALENGGSDNVTVSLIYV